MNAKEYLLEVGRLYHIYKNAQLRLEDARAEAGTIKAISYEKKEGTSGNLNTKSPQEKWVMKLLEREEDFKTKANAYYDYRMQAWELLAKLSNQTYYNILYHRYILNRKWEDVAKALHYQENTVKVYHREALDEFQQILNHSTDNQLFDDLL